MSENDNSVSILHVSEPVDGGVGRVVADLVSDQTRRGWRVAVASPSGGDLPRFVTSAGAVHLPWRVPARPQATRVDERPGLTAFSEALDLKRIVQAWRPDVVHLHSSKAGLLGRLVLRGAWPTLFQPHGWSFHAVDGVLRSGAVAWERIAARWADIIVCVSNGERRLGEQAGLRANWRVIPNGVNVSSYSGTSGDRASARRRLALGENVTVVCVGRLSRAKGQDVLLEAWPAVVSRVPDAQLILVGEGPDRDALRRRAIRGLTLVGHREDVPEWLSAADVVAIPSRWEGMSVTMLEAMARGRSIVATAVPGATEMLGEGNGALVPVENPVALGHALIERLLDPDLREREGHAARRAVERSCDLRHTTQRMAELYAGLVSERRGSIRTGRRYDERPGVETGVTQP